MSSVRRTTVVLAVAALLTGVPVAVDAAAATPVVAGLSSSSGPLVGGARIVVTGAHFARGAVVTFGATAGRSVSVTSSSRLSVVVPARPAGIVDVRVSVSGLRSALTTKDRYTYVAPPSVTSLSSTAGLTGGSARVTVRGAGFTSTTSVRFGASAATVLSRASGAITVLTPARPAGTVDVVATNVYGSSKPSPAARFTYRAAPQPVTAVRVAAVTPNSITLRWTPSTTTDVSAVVVRRAAGTVAPASLTDGAAVATVPVSATSVLDAGLDRSRTYSYTLWARTTAGPLYSATVRITVTTADAAAPDVPQLSTSPALGNTAGGCAAANPCVVAATDGSPFQLRAFVSHPESGQTMTARFLLRDITASADVLSPADPDGELTALPASGTTAVIQVAADRLTAGHVYAFRVVVTDSAGASTASPSISLRYGTAPA